MFLIIEDTAKSFIALVSFFDFELNISSVIIIFMPKLCLLLALHTVLL